MIKNWFMNKNFTSEERYAISTSGGYEVVRESEKAVALEWITDFGKITKWVPKSCIMSEEEVQKESQRIKNRNAEYENLITWCKENGIKGVRKGLRKSTIMQKIKAAGLKYN